MSDLYQNLIDRIRSEVLDLEEIIERAGLGWLSVQEAAIDQYAYVDSVALNLHGFYSGLERLFELIVRTGTRSCLMVKLGIAICYNKWPRTYLTHVLQLSARILLLRLTNSGASDIWSATCTQ